MITYRPQVSEKPLSCNLNHCEMFSCILGMEDETALSIIDPVTVNIEIVLDNLVKTLKVRVLIFCQIVKLLRFWKNILRLWLPSTVKPGFLNTLKKAPAGFMRLGRFTGEKQFLEVAIFKRLLVA